MLQKLRTVWVQSTVIDSTIRVTVDILYVGRLCNAVLFGVGPVEDPAEGLTVEDLEVDAKRLAQENDQPSEE